MRRCASFLLAAALLALIGAEEALERLDEVVGPPVVVDAASVGELAGAKAGEAPFAVQLTVGLANESAIRDTLRRAIDATPNGCTCAWVTSIWPGSDRVI